jgi:hypothetical protein
MNTGPTGKLLRQAANDSIRSRVREEMLTALEPFAGDGVVRLGAAVWIVCGKSSN